MVEQLETYDWQAQVARQSKYTEAQVERAAKRLYETAEDPDVAPGVYDLDFFRERVAADPGDYIQQEDL